MHSLSTPQELKGEAENQETGIRLRKVKALARKMPSGFVTKRVFEKS
jgi:hypothetical protein